MTVPLQKVLDTLEPEERTRVDALTRTLMAEQRTLTELRDSDGNMIPHSRALDLRKAAIHYICALRRAVESSGGTLTVAIDYPDLPRVAFPPLDDDTPDD